MGFLRGIRTAVKRFLDDDLETRPEAIVAAKKTWRYLRLAMVVMVIGLATSILFERSLTDCWQTSISAYYYTPAQGFLVGALVTIGVCLFSLKGNTDLEDILLNLAGVCAPFVALVPTPNPGKCGSVLYNTRHRDVNIENNVFALLTVLSIALVAVAALEIVNQIRDREGPPTKAEKFGFAAATIAVVLAWLLFYGADVWFKQNIHNITAISMFVFIWLNVLLNVRHLRAVPRTSRRRRSRVVYIWIGVLMPLFGILNLVAGLNEWPYAVISVEAELIALFAVFWIVQTIELWDEGLRATPTRPTGSEPPQPTTVAVP